MLFYVTLFTLRYVMLFYVTLLYVVLLRYATLFYVTLRYQSLYFKALEFGWSLFSPLSEKNGNKYTDKQTRQFVVLFDLFFAERKRKHCFITFSFVDPN